MLTALQKTNEKKIIAAFASRDDKPFACSECGSDVVLKKGALKVAHFAHKPPVTCDYGSGETEEHRRCKNDIYNSLSALKCLTECEMEKSFTVVRPDIYFRTESGVHVAIEVQISNLTIDTIVRRTAYYEKLGIYVLWMPSLRSSGLHNQSKIYSPKAWEKWLHQTYYGRVYYWSDALNVCPVKFDNYQLYVEETDYGGGYYKTSKRYVTPILLDMVRFPFDFQPKHRGSWQGKIYTPNSKIMLDNKSFSSR